MSKPGENRGEKNFKAKLSRDDVIAIFTDKTKTQQQLAEQYDVTQSTINHIKTGRTWSWLTSKLQDDHGTQS